MPSYTARQHVHVAATPQECFNALTDYERIPEWQTGIARSTVVESFAGGAVVDYELDAKVRTVSYRLRLSYDEPVGIAGTAIAGDFERIDAQWRFTAAGDGADVELAIDLDPGRFVPGPVRRVVQEFVMRGALRDLRRHLESDVS